jgi:hypothetical protein
VGAASWGKPQQDQAAGPLPVDVTLNIERQEPQGGVGKRQRTGGRGAGGQRPKREVVHVLLVLETSTGCRLGADALLEQQDLRAYRPPMPGLAPLEGPEPADPFALEWAARLVETLEVCL